MYTFIGHDNWSRIIPDHRRFYEKHGGKLYGKIEILRPLLWFYVGQNGVKIEDLGRWFSDEAIFKFVHDKFIKIEGLDG